MKTKLRKGEPCPIHQGSRMCCGRAQKVRYTSANPYGKRPPKTGWQSKMDYIGAGVWRGKDSTGKPYERRNSEAMRRLVKEKIKEQDGLCGICKKPFTDMREVVPDHIIPRGMNGGNRDDSPGNIQAAHNWPCNMAKGSQRNYEPSSGKAS